MQFLFEPIGSHLALGWSESFRYFSCQNLFHFYHSNYGKNHWTFSKTTLQYAEIPTTIVGYPPPSWKVQRRAKTIRPGSINDECHITGICFPSIRIPQSSITDGLWSKGLNLTTGQLFLIKKELDSSIWQFPKSFAIGDRRLQQVLPESRVFIIDFVLTGSNSDWSHWV